MASQSLPAMVGDFTQEQADLVKRTIAKGATDDELKMFIYLANKYDLDPFAKEIWFIKRVKKTKDSKGQWNYPRLPNGDIDYSDAETTIMTSRDGYLKIAQQNPDYDGLIAFVVKEGDDFYIDADEYKVHHRFGTQRGKIIGAWARCDRQGRKPQLTFVDFSEYNAGQGVWQKYPSSMIQKVAETFVLKRQFNISGLVTQEELNITQIDDIPPVTPVNVTPHETTGDEPKTNVSEFSKAQQTVGNMRQGQKQNASQQADNKITVNDLVLAGKLVDMKINDLKDLAGRISGGEAMWPKVPTDILSSMRLTIEAIAKNGKNYSDYKAEMAKVGA